jgi:hypothetical protein
MVGDKPILVRGLWLLAKLPIGLAQPMTHWARVLKVQQL